MHRSYHQSPGGTETVPSQWRTPELGRRGGTSAGKRGAN
jgi:hypothetical protein